LLHSRDLTSNLGEIRGVTRWNEITDWEEHLFARSRTIALITIAVAHAVFITYCLASNGVFIHRQEQAPAYIFYMLISFLGYAWLHVGFTILQKSNRVSASEVVTSLYRLGLGPAVILSVLILPWLGFAGAGSPSGFQRTIPFLGQSPRGDETAVLLVSWLLTSSVAFALTSPKTVTAQMRHDTQNVDEGGPNGPYFTVRGLSANREFVISQLAIRAHELEKRSGYILISIVFMLVCAALFIVFAGQITSLDVSGVKPVSLAQADVRSAEDELDRIISEITRNKEARRRAKEQAAKGEQRLDTGVPEDTQLSDEATSLRLEAKKAALKKANDVLLSVKEKQFEAERPKDQTSAQTLLIQTSVTRFGVVLIMVFLVQILVNLYRYNKRLSAFYFGRADALILLGKGLKNFRILTEVVTPDKLDFGKPPRTPGEEAAGLLAAWAGRIPRPGGARAGRGSTAGRTGRRARS
jgi:hypothetical protein